MALIENGALAHSSQAYLASPAHYHPTTTQRAAPPIELVDDFIDFVDPVLRPALPILPPPILPAYHHGKLQFFARGKIYNILFCFANIKISTSNSNMILFIFNN